MTINGLHESICPERQIHNECFLSHLDEIAIHAFQVDNARDRLTSNLDGATAPPTK